MRAVPPSPQVHNRLADANLLLSKGTSEQELTTYLCSHDCPAHIRLNPNYEDAGFQVFLLHTSMSAENKTEYLIQYDKYFSWVTEQNRQPNFYWNNTVAAVPPLDMIRSPYHIYLDREKCNPIITNLRDKPEVMHLEHDQPWLLSTEPGMEMLGHELVSAAERVSRRRRIPDGQFSKHKFGSHRALEESALFLGLASRTTEKERRSFLVGSLPCIHTKMNREVYRNIIQEILDHHDDSKAVLLPLARYESMLRDIMEESDLTSYADLYFIGRKTSKMSQAIAQSGDVVDDVLDTQCLSLRFLAKKRELQKIAERPRRIMETLVFVRSEYTALSTLCQLEEKYNYDILREMVSASKNYIPEGKVPISEDGLEDVLIAAVKWCRFLIASIDECIRTIGTDKYLKLEILSIA